MQLTSLDLKNFRQFESIHIDFDKRMTVLVGPNSSGKSAVLDAAAIALGTFFYALDVPTKTIAKSDARIVSRPIGGREEVRASYPVKVDAKGTILGKEIQWSRTLNTSSGATTRVNARQMTDVSQEVRDSLDDVAAEGRSNELVLPLISYYGTGRLWSQKKAPQSGSFDPYRRESGYQNCLDASSDEKRLMSWMSSMDYAEYKEKRVIPQYKAVCDMLAGLYSSIARVQGVSVSYDSRKNDISVSYEQNDGVIELPMRNLSDGYRTVLGMIGDMAYRMCELNPQFGERAPQETPGIVLVDEVDLHLHPKWQVRVLRDLMDLFPKIQFIVTTHAPSVIASVDRQSIRQLDGIDQAAVPASQTYGRDASSIFREVMGAPERQYEIADMFDKLYSALDAEDLAIARQLVSSIGEKIGENDPDLTAARTTLSLME